MTLESQTHKKDLKNKTSGREYEENRKLFGRHLAKKLIKSGRNINFLSLNEFVDIIVNEKWSDAEVNASVYFELKRLFM